MGRVDEQDRSKIIMTPSREIFPYKKLDKSIRQLPLVTWYPISFPVSNPCRDFVPHITISTSSNSILDQLIALIRRLKHVPNIIWHILESFIESLGLVLIFYADGCDVRHLADEDQLDPALVLAVTIHMSAYMPEMKREVRLLTSRRKFQDQLAWNHQ